ncbi:MAG: hypothetical protein FWD76_03605 [Firmicutes bacterium]|nr:hypothetical protein [Bacillota bacterium]
MNKNILKKVAGVTVGVALSGSLLTGAVFGPRGIHKFDTNAYSVSQMAEPRSGAYRAQKSVARANANFNVPSKVLLGTPVSGVPSGAVVKDPADRIVSLSNSEFVPTQLGFYSIEAANYTYLVESYIQDTPVLEVSYQDGDKPLPSVAKVDTEYKLPMMQIVTYDKSGDRTVLTDSNGALAPTVSVVSDGGRLGDFAPGDSFKTPDTNTTVFVRYEYRDAANQIPYISQDYTIKVQSNYKNDDKPTLNVAAPSNGNVNVKFDLPKATGYDKYDGSALRYDITVTKDGNPVGRVKVDGDTGYALPDQSVIDPNDPAFVPELFDNNRNMSFYPTSIGEYVLTYTATNSQGNKSDPLTFSLRVLDNTAPTFREIADYKIPSQWGLNSVQKLGDSSSSTTAPNGDPTEAVDHKIKFPTALDMQIVDNNSKTGGFEEEIDKADKITVSMSMTNPQGDTILSYSDLFGNPYQTNQADTTKYGNKDLQLVNADGSSDGFDFLSYRDAVANDGSKVVEGDYTVTYRARDAKNQVSTKSYKITLKNELIDTVRPIINMEANAFSLLPKTIVAGRDLDLALPTPDVSDTVSQRLHTVYQIADGQGNKYDVKDGQRLVYVEGNNADGDDATGVYLTKRVRDADIIEEGNLLALSGDSGEFVLTIDTEDSVGNYAVDPSKNDDTRWVATQKIAVVSQTWQDGKLDSTLAGDSGSVSFSDANLAGFELVVRRVVDDKGNALARPQPINDVSVTIESDSNGLTLSNISYNAPSAGEYSMSLRAFDINGGNAITGLDNVRVTAPGRVGNLPVASRSGVASVDNTLPTSIVVGEAFALPEYKGELSGTDTVVRTINGGAFELVGNMFTPKATTTYTFDDRNSNGGTQLGNDKYYSTAKDTDAPTLRFAEDRGVAQYLPLSINSAGDWNTNYVDGDAIMYILPSVVASNKNQNFVVDKPTITDNNGGTHTPIDDAKVVKGGDSALPGNGYDNSYLLNGGDASDADGTQIIGWGFKPTRSGMYTVNYTASGNGLSGSLSFTIYVGNITTPNFRLTNPAQTTAVANAYSFDFSVVEMVGSFSDDQLKTFKYTKILYDPSHNEVAKIEGEGETYRTKTNNGSSWTLDKSGQYSVEYRVKNPANGFDTTVIETINVSAASTNTPIPLAVISTVLVAAGVVLLLGAFVYLVKFRKIKVPSEQHKGKVIIKEKGKGADTKTEAKAEVVAAAPVVETQPLQYDSTPVQPIFEQPMQAQTQEPAVAESATTLETQPVIQDTEDKQGSQD